jgi:hypothetical protein
MVNSSFEIQLPVTIDHMRTDVLLQPFEYAERVQGFVPLPAGALPTEQLCVFGSFLSHGFDRHGSNSQNLIRPARAIFAGHRNFTMQPVVSDAPRANADGAATQMKRKPSPAGVSRLFRPRHRHRKFRMLDEPGPDELLDDWMISGPATEPASSG